MSLINIVAQTNESTVVTEYKSLEKKRKEYQSEDELEKELIANLESQGISHLPIHEEKDLILNLRTQLEKLNDYHFTDNEWNTFFSEKLHNPNDSIKEKTKLIQQDYIQELHCENGSLRNIKLIDKKNIHANSVQVINQYENNDGTYKNRYDVTLLVNGFPMIHIELKRRGVAIREAFNQINRYQRDSFWASCGLYEFVQLFVISNGTNTKYYSNTTRNAHIKEFGANQSEASKKKTSNSFKFTSYWADAKNKIIPDLVDFTRTFLTRHTLLNVLTKYCVFTSEELLLVMRPYQIVATERILNKILVSSNYKKQGTIDAGGYIWHTTGSGKTLTSFKTAQLATELTDIEKVLFVVDRKDLDYQTIKEYDKFEKGAANGNNSTRILQKQLEDNQSKIIVTTIQKLNCFIAKNKIHDIYNKHIVIIFDECHRSQFGEMHTRIVKNFKKYHLFGFTGTPIFAQNASACGDPTLKTTEQAFGEQLHTYTIVNAINDDNVLPFRIDYINTMKKKNINDKDVAGIDTVQAIQDPQRIHDIVEYILEHFDQKTRRNKSYALKGKRMFGFNSIFAVDSIPMAMKYYNEFKKQMEEPGKQKLNIATIFSFNPNEENPDVVMADEDFDVSKLDKNSRDFLEDAIRDYNLTFHTNYNTSDDEFQNYYKDLSLKMKNREVDLLIVVNMFLTGFDATTLNTLWVDKNLKMHGLIQAFSRTNRILNSVKTYGNIVCFRNLEQEVEDALSLFGDENASGVVLLKTFNDYYYGYDEENKHYRGYVEMIDELLQNYPLGQQIIRLEDKKKFIALFGSILKARNVLVSFDEFVGKEILSPLDFQDYKSIYLDLYNELKKDKEAEKEIVNEDIVFEIELIKQVEVNIDYILDLVAKYHRENCQDKEILLSITKTINGSIKMRSKKQLIIDFIEKLNNPDETAGEWKRYITQKKNEELDTIIQDNNLKADLTHTYLQNAFKDGFLRTTGVDFDALFPTISRFGGKRKAIKEKVMDLLNAYFEKYYDVI